MLSARFTPPSPLCITPFLDLLELMPMPMPIPGPGQGSEAGLGFRPGLRTRSAPGTISKSSTRKFEEFTPDAPPPMSPSIGATRISTECRISPASGSAMPVAVISLIVSTSAAQSEALLQVSGSANTDASMTMTALQSSSSAGSSLGPTSIDPAASRVYAVKVSTSTRCASNVSDTSRSSPVRPAVRSDSECRTATFASNPTDDEPSRNPGA
mmetsp:Transcript_33323/g.83970  ORF Transcript_33323/g.83970 Transcript_33323/m.83970 type:complete len:212 (+) Transcript_33323:1582-2217(+)